MTAQKKFSEMQTEADFPAWEIERVQKAKSPLTSGLSA
jgi:hypothetical protein